MDLGQLIYGTCSAAFVALIALMLLRGRISGPGIAILAACVLTAVWSADLGVLRPAARKRQNNSGRFSIIRMADCAWEC